MGRSGREAEWRTYLRQQLGVKDDRKVGGIVEDIPESSVEMQHGVDPTAVVVLEPIYNLVGANKQRVKPPLKRPPPKRRDTRGPDPGTSEGHRRVPAGKRKAPAAPIGAGVEPRGRKQEGAHTQTHVTHTKENQQTKAAAASEEEGRRT